MVYPLGSPGGSKIAIARPPDRISKKPLELPPWVVQTKFQPIRPSSFFHQVAALYFIESYDIMHLSSTPLYFLCLAHALMQMHTRTRAEANWVTDSSSRASVPR